MSTDATPETPLHEQPAIYAQRWFILGVMCLSLVLVVMAVSGLNVALPTMQRDLAATGTELQWIIDAYAIVFAGLLLSAGAIGDRFGRKGALQVGLVVFGIGALIGAEANNALQVIMGRAVMGIGAAFTMPATLSIITAVFPPEERTRAIAIWAGFAGAGGAIGPIISGILLTGWWIVPQFWWGAAFLVNVPVIVGVLAAVTLYTPKSRDTHATPLDPVGAGLSLVGLSALVFAIIEGPEQGWTSGAVVGSFTAALVLLGAFTWWEAKADHPMLPLAFFRSRQFSVGSSVITLVFFVMFGFFFLQTLYLQFVLDYSALGAGVATLPLALAVVAVAPRSSTLGERFGPGSVMGVGFVFIAAGLFVLTAASTATTYPLLAVSFVMLGIGLALASAPATGSIMVSVPLDKAGVGSAVNDTTRELGGSLGIAVMGSMIATIYRATLDLGTVALPPELAETAGESIGASLRVASQIGGGTGAEIVSAAQASFATAFAWTMGIGAVMALVAGAITWSVMRGRTTRVFEG